MKRFPTIAGRCKKCGIDITKDFIPVSPAAHYFMGGVKTDLSSQTSIKNLYAIGEVSSTGLHGANRLASNSLLECVVFAYSLAQNLQSVDLNTLTENFDKDLIEKYENPLLYDRVETSVLKSQIRETMWENVGIFRDAHSLNSALRTIKKISEQVNRKDKCFDIGEYELRNMLITAELVVQSALNRKESRGAHYRTDYLDKTDICEHSIVKNEKGEISFAK